LLRHCSKHYAAVVLTIDRASRCRCSHRTCKNFHSLPGTKLPNLGAYDPIFCAASSSMPSAWRSDCFPLVLTARSEVGERKLRSRPSSTRDRRSPLTTRRMSRIAKGSLLQGPLFSKTSARADSQKRRSRIPFRIASCARKRESCGRGGRQCWRVLTRTRGRYAQPH
jgi:hypothetical protein